MKELFKKTLRIFRTHPVLWIPLVVVERANVWIWWSRHKAHQEITKYFLSKIPLSPSPSQDVRDALRMHVTWAYIPGGFGLQLVIACLLAVSLFVTAKMVGMILEGKAPRFPESLITTVKNWKRILLFSLKFLAVFSVFLLAFCLPLLAILEITHHHEMLKLGVPAYMMGAIFDGCLAWLFMPTIIKFLQPADDQFMPEKCRMTGFVIAGSYGLLLTALICIFDFLAPQMTIRSNIGNIIRNNTIAAITDLAGVLLFIAFSLVALDRKAQPEILQIQEVYSLETLNPNLTK